jgi:multicomponent Na+:H+ antiporter subunit F
MTALLYAVAVFLALNVLVGLVRVAIGPSGGDRLLAALLFGTTGVALLAVLSAASDVPALRNVSLVLVVLAALVVVVFVGDEVTGRDRGGGR